jgi:hypothetical protein
MLRSKIRQLACLLGVGLSSAVFAASPTVTRISPAGGQRGTEIEVTFSGDRLADAAELMFYTPGFVVTDLKAEAKKVTAKIKIDSARLGEHQLRLRTKSGLSELRTFYVGPLPMSPEKEPNTDFAKPQKIELNTTITGVVENEDMDYFVVEAKKGQRITAEVEGMRIGQAMFDPYVAILDTNRFEIAACDDSPLGLQDPVVSILAPADGQYIIQVRESSYGGNGNCAYRLHVGTFPRPRVAFPLGGQAGTDLHVTLLGDARGEIQQTIKLPSGDNVPEQIDLFAEQDNLLSPTPNRIRVSPFANIVEAEPNDDAARATTYDGELPIALNGVIASPGDYDFYKVRMKKGQAYDIQVHARSLRSPLDSVVNVISPGGGGGGQGGSNDDNNKPDSYLRFSAPADGEYQIRIRDHLRRGGPEFAYRIEITPVKPKLELSIPQMVQYTQERQAISVPRGNRFGALIRASRKEFGGELVLAASDLPQGVKLVAEPIPAGIDQAAVIFEADADAPIAGRLSNLTATVADGKTKVEGQYRQPIELIYGPPNQTPYYDVEATRLAVAVTEESPFALSIIEPRVPIVQGGSLNLKVKAERKGDFKGPIAVRLLYNPPGINASVTAKIDEGKDETVIPLSAADNAQAKAWKITVIGSGNVNGPLWVSTPLTTLTVAAPFLSMKLEPASVLRGQETTITANVDHKTPFDGKAKAHLGGLPANVSAEDVEIAPGESKVTFKIKTTDKAPPGAHKSLLCRVVVNKDGEEIVHNLGRGGTLRIDAPLKTGKDDKKVASADKATEKPRPEKPAKKEAGK